jgi:transcriptional regulator of acetoin/glycerol metabolism
LQNAIERACALATGDRVEVRGLPDEVRQHQSLFIASEHVRPLRQIEREYILAALERNHGNRTLTAHQLDIAPATLFRKLKEYANGQAVLLLAMEAARRSIEIAGAV